MAFLGGVQEHALKGQWSTIQSLYVQKGGDGTLEKFVR